MVTSASLLNLSYRGQANFLFFAPIMNLFKDPRLLIEDGQYHTEVNKRIVNCWKILTLQYQREQQGGYFVWDEQ